MRELRGLGGGGGVPQKHAKDIVHRERILQLLIGLGSLQNFNQPPEQPRCRSSPTHPRTASIIHLHARAIPDNNVQYYSSTSFSLSRSVSRVPRRTGGNKTWLEPPSRRHWTNLSNTYTFHLFPDPSSDIRMI